MEPYMYMATRKATNDDTLDDESRRIELLLDAKHTNGHLEKYALAFVRLTNKLNNVKNMHLSEMQK